ncbi:MAG: FixH family protein [Notoacmeibacter sp.]
MNSAAQRPFTGRHMLIIMLAFFGVIFAANFTMAYFAFSSWTGLVVKNSYVASQNFNDATARLEEAAHGANPTIIYEKGKLTISLRDIAGNPVMATEMKVAIGRPSFEGQDQEIKLIPEGQGVFSANHVLGKGQWAGEVHATINNANQWQRPIYIMVRD